MAHHNLHVDHDQLACTYTTDILDTYQSTFYGTNSTSYFPNSAIVHSI